MGLNDHNANWDEGGSAIGPATIAGAWSDTNTFQPNQYGENIDRSRLLDVYRAMVTARIVDRYQADFIRRGDATFHIPGDGHEPIAALGPYLTPQDWIAAHYRDKALLLFRGVAPAAFLSATLCRSTAPGAGRQLPDIVGSRAHRVLSTPVPVGNHALHAVGVAAATVELDPHSDAIVVCTAGDGTSQQGEFLEAMCEAVRRQLPVLFVIEDNGLAISTRTHGMTVFSTPTGAPPHFLNMPITKITGRDVRRAVATFSDVVSQVRYRRRPAVVSLTLDRLTSHTNADNHRLYRGVQELALLREHDPISCFERDLEDLSSPDELAEIRAASEASVAAAAADALVASRPSPTASAKAPLPSLLVADDQEHWLEAGGSAATMAEAIRGVLRNRLESDPRTVLIGQDIEDPKGDVFGTTRGLSTRFPGRVLNAALSESTIVGTAIGRAIAGQRPVALIQFADFLPLAFNQIANELGTMFWRTAGEYSCPVVIMAPCGGYKPGMGPFHSQTFDGTAVHLPGIDVVMPSTPADACGLLNNALDSPRPTLFLYPKALLNVREKDRSFEVTQHRVAIGRSHTLRPGRDLTIVGWGNTVHLALRVASTLGEWEYSAEVLDLRSLSPWDETRVIESAERTGRLLIAHEDNLSGGLGSEIAARVAERASKPPRILRVARPDVPIPCDFESQLAILPGYRTTLSAAAQLLGLEIKWDRSERNREPETFAKHVIGSGTSETVSVTHFRVRSGDRVAADDIVATVESSKRALEVISPQSAKVDAVTAHEAQELPKGSTSAEIRPDKRSGGVSRVSELEPRAILVGRHIDSVNETSTGGRQKRTPIRIIAVRGATGGRVMGHHELLQHHPRRTVDDVKRLTGIESRRWIADGEDAIGLAVIATQRALSDVALSPADLDLVLCSTTTPSQITPSMACGVMARLGGTRAPAYDVSAACSGYLYTLQIAHDFLQARGSGRVLILTAEAMSTRTDVRNFDTAFLFGDAATATVLATGADRGHVVHRPVLAAKPEPGDALSVPLTEGGFVRMKGGRVFAEAVREMAAILDQACQDSGLRMADLDCVVPHQANLRILEAVEARVGRPVVRHLRHIGNTSSSSIPLALEAHIVGRSDPRRIGLCAFGGGFTSGAAVIELPLAEC
jgi:2-oxoisovalerate dehydrogenase E1 component